jgi:hypothetical protein
MVVIREEIIMLPAAVLAASTVVSLTCTFVRI